ncbi:MULTISPECIES: cobalamin B12-binding domain-containing protein [unclassified Streptomyces]|uniref:cobalamin B12-binding domain-containing protein n=1 Tax=unclassified Streptomyces TaxID=2593676 RepID=UPI00070FD606|nr:MULTISPECIES: cobalamin B12-binding domain-containing protein [unclassified Streptomyces]KRD19920.1 cobalamin-binding protein [Streptomyces sp. Root264]
MTAGAGTGTDPTALSARLWAAVIGRDESAAVRMVTAAADAGADEEALLLDVVAGVQQRVGAEWAADRISVAEEHAASAITDRIVAALAHRRPVPSGPHERGRITVACVDGEWHFLPARLLAEVLVRRGWRVDFLGAHTPTPHLVAHVHRANPVAVLLSASIPTHLPAAHKAVTAVQSLGVPVMVGGAAFGPDGRYARLVQADGWAPDARTAADRLARGVTPPRTDRRHGIHDLSHLADQEYTLVKGSRTTLVRSCLSDLDERLPAMRSYTPAQRERTAEDLAHIVDFLATALYVDDADLFTTFTTWSAGILTARGVPAHSLRLGLGVLAERLHDFPRALTFLRTALDALPATPAHRERR